MKLYIITGASRGLGAAIAEALTDPGHRLICMVRNSAPLISMQQRAAANRCSLEFRIADLHDADAAVAALESALASVDQAQLRSLTLINNAGLVDPIGPVEKLQPHEVAAAVAVNLTSPIALCSAFLRLSSTWQIERRILNISTGAARSAYAGWSVYCATKAALDHFTRCLALEQSGQPNGARVVALAPGVIDTAMQASVRDSAPEDFPELARFIGLKESGQLATPTDAALRVLRYLERPDFGTQPVDDIRKH